MIKRQIPNLITLCNLACGVLSVFAALALDYPVQAALLICLGILFDFFDGLTALYAGAVYGTTEGRPHELSYARCLKFLLQGQGFRVMQEVAHASGRTDIVADHPCGTYVFELKVDKPPKLAMSQIQRRKYTAPYRATGKPVWAVVLSFDGKTRQFNGGVAEAI